MTKSILLIRHAQSANNALPEWERVPDPALTKLGTQQASLLARALTARPIAQLFCSPFRRSLDTTLPISQQLGLRPIIRADIYEQGGCYSGYEPEKLKGEPGMSCAELATEYPTWDIDPAIGPHGWNIDREYETDAAVQLRARSVAYWLAQVWQPIREGTQAALVIHADFKRLLIEEMLGTDRWPDSYDPIWNTAITQLDWHADHWSLAQWNSVDHLPDDLRS